MVELGTDAATGTITTSGLVSTVFRSFYAPTHHARSKLGGPGALAVGRCETSGTGER